MKAKVGPFACRCIEHESGQDLASVILSALDFYANGLAAGPIKPDLPLFLMEEDSPVGDGFEIEIDDKLFAIFACEAFRRSVALGDLLNHAVFLYLAHLSACGPGPRPWQSLGGGGSVQRG